MKLTRRAVLRLGVGASVFPLTTPNPLGSQSAKAADASVKDLDSFKAAFANIGKNDCGGCHEKYRLKKS